MMLTHSQIWTALDRLAARAGLSPSGLAKKSGLDPTAFNLSKRHGADKRPRWPSTESIAKVLAATGESLEGFVGLAKSKEQGPLRPVNARRAFRDSFRLVPLLGLAQAGAGGFFDDGGFPAGQGWEEIAFPGPTDDSAYALEVAGDSMLPLYRDGDVLIVEPGGQVRRGDRVVVKTREGEVMAKVLFRQTSKAIELVSLNTEHPNRSFDLGEVEWIARIIWASQ